jgi:hypothetical protein
VWDAGALRFWHDYRRATIEQRSLALLEGGDTASAADAAKHVLSDAVIDQYFASQNPLHVEYFLNQLYGRYYPASASGPSDLQNRGKPCRPH